MIKVTREFATPQEAAAWLTGGQAPAPHFAPNVAPAPATPTVPTGGFAPQPGAPVQPAAPAPTAAQPATQASAGITQAQIATAAQAYSKAYKPTATKAVFTQFGITKISEARPDQYPALLAALTVQAA